MSEKIILPILTLPIFVTLFFLYNYMYAAVTEESPIKHENVRPAHGSKGRLGIYGGVAVEDDAEFPFQLKLYHFTRTLESPGGIYRYCCGAAIMGERFGITAAHCLGLFDINKDPASFQVVAGNATHRYWFPATSENSSQEESSNREQRRRLTKFVIHPDWNFTAADDIAIFQLDRNFSFNKRVNKIRIPRENPTNSSNYTEALEISQNLIGSTAWVIGWGWSTDSWQPTVLQKVEIPIVDCSKFFSSSELPGAHPMCGGTTQKDSCEGESGGPLFTNVPSSSPLLVGIVSAGDDGCAGPRPGVYTDVGYYAKWIHDTRKYLHT